MWILQFIPIQFLTVSDTWPIRSQDLAGIHRIYCKIHSEGNLIVPALVRSMSRSCTELQASVWRTPALCTHGFHLGFHDGRANVTVKTCMHRTALSVPSVPPIGS